MIKSNLLIFSEVLDAWHPAEEMYYKTVAGWEADKGTARVYLDILVGELTRVVVRGRRDHILHIAGDTQQIFSGVHIEIDPELLENCAKLLNHLYIISLQPFYQSTNLSLVTNIVKDRIKEGVRVHKKSWLIILL